MLCIFPPSHAPLLLSNGVNTAGFMTQANCGSGPNKIIWTQSSEGRGANKLGFGPDKQTKCESTLI